MGFGRLQLVALYILFLGHEGKDLFFLPLRSVPDNAVLWELYQEAFDYFEAKLRVTEIPKELLEKYALASPIGVAPRIQILADLHLGSTGAVYTKEAE